MWRSVKWTYWEVLILPESYNYCVFEIGVIFFKDRNFLLISVMPIQVPAVSVDTLAARIHLVRGQKVMLDADLAELYGVPTKRFNEQVKRNIERFPADFMFQLTNDEHESLRSQFAPSNAGRGGRRYSPYAFTESLNSLIQVMNRMGRGYSFEALRAKILFSRGAHKSAQETGLQAAEPV